jgi:hypothetical protein
VGVIHEKFVDGEVAHVARGMTLQVASGPVHVDNFCIFVCVLAE